MKKFLIGVSTLGLVVIGISVAYIFSPAASQARAEKSLSVFLSSDKTTYKTKGCAADTDGDGYGSCTLVDQNNQQIMYQCTSSLFSVVPLFGSQSCKGQMQEILKLK